MRVRWLRYAVRNLHDICDYIATENPEAAEGIGARIESAVEMLASHPQAGRPGRVAGTRELVVPGTPYIVVYAVAKQIAILAVLHAARRWPKQF